jgi:lysophospholipase L1-like esterase
VRLAVILLAAIAAASAILHAPTPAARTPLAPVAQLRIMPLGDSITSGSLAEAQGGYRGPLEQMLGRGTFVGSQTDAAGRRHEGHSGYRIDQLAEQARTWAAAAQPTVVLIDAGANDVGQGASAAQMFERMTRLLAEVRAGVGPKCLIVVAQTTIVTFNPLEQQAIQAAFNAQLGTLAGPRVTIVDMTGLELGDKIHPTPEAYKGMAARWYAVIPQVTAA